MIVIDVGLPLLVGPGEFVGPLEVGADEFVEGFVALAVLVGVLGYGEITVGAGFFAEVGLIEHLQVVDCRFVGHLFVR